MIIKARSITKDHAINVLNYVIREEKDHIPLDSDGADISSAYAFVGDAALYKKDRVKKAFVSMVISPHIQDNLKHENLKELLHEVFNELKLDNRQFFAVVHQNTKTPHIHVVANRIDYDFNTWNDHHIAFECQRVCKAVSKKLGLTYANDRKETYKGRVEAPKNEWQKKRYEDKNAIIQVFNQVKYEALDIDYVFSHLQENGIEVQIKQLKNGMFGVSFEYNGTKIKASAVHHLLTVVPDKENGGYKANKRFQKVIDMNLDKMMGIRTEKDLIRDLNDESKVDYTQVEYNLEIPTLIQFNMDRYWDQIKQNNEEERQKYLAKKYGRRHRPIGFKIPF